MRTIVTSLTLLVASLVSASAHASRPYLTLVDDGTIESRKVRSSADVAAIEKKLLALYGATGAPLPEVLSVWSTFDLGGNPVGTFFDPLSSDVKGIGLESYYPDGLVSKHPPLSAMLLHNNVLKLDSRAKLQQAPVDGFAEYLFLLELSHRFGPALNVPDPGSGALIGFDFHWSFWMDAGGSPSGGNVWKDNGDGTFTAVAADPKKLKFSPIDLYVMGLAPKSEVPPFGVLVDVTPPAGITDPLWGGAYDAHSFPWFDASRPFVAKATRRVVTIDDVITVNGPRVPDATAAPKSWTLGIVLLVSKDDGAAAIDAAHAAFDPIAPRFAPAFADATSGRGSLKVVTEETSTSPGADAGAQPDVGGDASDDAAATGGATEKGGCATSPRSGASRAAALVWVLAALAVAARRLRDAGP